jgi:3-oxoacyl-[acyl-carrier-protein] synthase-1
MTEILLYSYSTDWNYHSCFNSNFIDIAQSTFPLVVSTSTGTISTNKIHHDFYIEKRKRGKPSELRESFRDGLISLVASKLNLAGYVVNVSAECSGSLYALHVASMLSKQMNSPVFVFVADNLLADEIQMWRFNSFGALDQNTGRAFDDSSRGFRMGAGSALMLIKHPDVTHDLSAIAVISNYNFYTNPTLISNPGASVDLINSIKNIDFSSINVWNAHATGTPIGDRFEYEVFSSLIKHNAPIVGYKSYFGHCITASGAIEICSMIDDYRSGLLRPNIIKGSKIINDDRIITEPVKFPGTRIIKASFGFGGKNAICQIDIQ